MTQLEHFINYRNGYSIMDRQWSFQSSHHSNSTESYQSFGTSSNSPLTPHDEYRSPSLYGYAAPEPCQRFGLFLGDLSSFCTEYDIREEFQHFGEIAEIRVKHGKDNAKALCYGFIEYTSLEAAVEAMKAMNGQLLKGRQLRIRWASNRGSAGAVRNTSREQESQAPSIHVRFSSKDISRLVTEEDLRKVFSSFGEVADCTVKQSTIDQSTMLCHGYGFVAFADSPEGLKSAYMVAEAMRDATYDNVRYKCELSRKLQMKVSGRAPHPLNQGMMYDRGASALPSSGVGGNSPSINPHSFHSTGTSRHNHPPVEYREAQGYNANYSVFQQQQPMYHPSRSQNHYRNIGHPADGRYASTNGLSFNSSYRTNVSQNLQDGPPNIVAPLSKAYSSNDPYVSGLQPTESNPIHLDRTGAVLPHQVVTAIPHFVPPPVAPQGMRVANYTDAAVIRGPQAVTPPVRERTNSAPSESFSMSGMNSALGDLSLSNISSNGSPGISLSISNTAHGDNTSNLFMSRDHSFPVSSISGTTSGSETWRNLPAASTDSRSIFSPKMTKIDQTSTASNSDGDIQYDRSHSGEGKFTGADGGLSPATIACTSNGYSSPSSRTSLSDAMNTLSTADNNLPIPQELLLNDSKRTAVEELLSDEGE